jgi:uncharacterized cupredoxin-like copper-binding protein
MKTRALLLLLPAVAVGSAHAATGTTVKLKADPGGDIAFTKTKLSAPAGKVTIRMKNPKGSFSEHGIAIVGHGKGKVVNPGARSSITATLKPGRYTYYCPVAGHKAAGMKGTLTVK